MRNNNFLSLWKVSAFIVFVILFLFGGPTLAAIGTPHLIYGKVFNSSGASPEKANLEIYAYIPARPGEILDKSSVGSGYDLFFFDGWLWFEAGNFITPWSINENVRLILVDTLLYETGTIDLVLNSSGNQLLPDLYLIRGDNVGPIVSNAMVDNSIYAFIPEGTGNITLTAIVDDSISGNSNIQNAEYFVDTDPGWGSGISMNPSDGLFDSPQEGVSASVNTSSWTEGSTHTIYVRGKDVAGNWGTTHMVSVEVIPSMYQFLGFLPPIKNDGSSVFKTGSTVPVKFQLKDENGNFAYTGTGRLTLQKYSEDMPIGDPVDATSSGSANNGNEFRYNEYNNLYIYNLSTKPLSVGKWNLIVTMEDGSVYEVFIQLK